MKLFKNFNLGITSFFKSFGFISKNRLWLHVFIPGSIALLIFIIMFLLGMHLIKIWVDNVIDYLGFNEITTGFVKILLIVAETFIKAILYFIFTLLVIILYKTIILIFCSPFLFILVDKIYEILNNNNKNSSFSITQIIKDSQRAIKISIRNFFYEMLYTILLLLLCFIPILGYVIPFIMIIISSYYTGFSFIDYTCEKYKMNVKSTVKFINENKGLAISTGMIFNILIIIPIIGALLAPSLCVSSATIAANSLLNEKNMNS